MSYSFLISPYSDPSPVVMEERYTKTLAAVAYLYFSRSVAVYSPIIHWHPVATRFNLNKDVDTWRTANAPLLRDASDVIVLELPGWLDSNGVASELSAVATFDIPRHHLTTEPINRWLKSLGYTPI